MDQEKKKLIYVFKNNMFLSIPKMLSFWDTNNIRTCNLSQELYKNL